MAATKPNAPIIVRAVQKPIDDAYNRVPTNDPIENNPAMLAARSISVQNIYIA
jgi:hypothetical protein